MAGEKTLANLSVRIGADTRQFKKGMATAKKRTTAFQRQMKSMGTAIAGAFSVMVIARFGMQMVQTAKDFEFAMSNVKAITKATDKEFAALTRSAKKLGATTMFKASEVANLQTEYAKIGFTTREILAAAEATLMLATATDSDLAQAAEVAGATIRAFGKSAKATQETVDLMAESFTSSALNIERWQETMKFAAPIAKVAGVEMHELAAMMAILADAGIHGSVAGTALKKIISELAISGEPLADTLQRLADEGVNLADAEKLVGERGKAGLLVLIDQISKVHQLTEEFKNNKGAAEEMAAVKMDTFTGSTAALASAWEGFNLAIAQSNGLLKTLVDRLTAAFRSTTIDLPGMPAGGGMGFFFMRLFGFGDKAVQEVDETFKKIRQATKDEIVAMLNEQAYIISIARRNEDKEAEKAALRRIKTLSYYFTQYQETEIDAAKATQAKLDKIRAEAEKARLEKAAALAKQLSTYEGLIRFAKEATDPAIAAEYYRQAAAVRALNEEFDKLVGKELGRVEPFRMAPITGAEVVPTDMGAGATEATNEQLSELREGLISTADAYQMLGNAAQSASDQMVEAMFDADKNIGEALISIVKQIIKSALKIIAAKFAETIASSFAGGASVGGPFAPATGAAVAAVGAASFMAIVPSLAYLAKGGIIPDGYPGDTFPAMLSSREAVIPLDKYDIGGSQNITIHGEISGDKIVFVYDKSKDRLTRNS